MNEEPDDETAGCDTVQYATALAPLMGRLKDPTCRAAAVAAFARLGKLDSSLSEASDLLLSLNAWSASQVSM